MRLAYAKIPELIKTPCHAVVYQGIEMIQVKSRSAVQRDENGTPICGAICYIHPTEPVLLRRLGRQIGSDVHDGFFDAVSTDNGATWSEPRPALARVELQDGYTVFIENTLFYNAQRDKVVHLVDQVFQRQLKHADHGRSGHLRITVASPQEFAQNRAKPSLISDFGVKQSIYVSFTHPFETASGKLLVPVQWQSNVASREADWDGFAVRSDMNDVFADVWETGLLIGTWNEQNELDWVLGNPVPYSFGDSSRGMCEGTVTELAGGKLAMVLRGSNAAWLDKPSYKWVSFSEDGGLSWSKAQPWACDDGSLLQSSATGSVLFRSIKDGKLYWIGNICADGQPAQGNWPRSPLYIARVCEEPFTLVRESITPVATHTPEEGEHVQHSNFRFYQDRETGEAVVYLTRFGERGVGGTQWLDADLYEYRVAV